MSLDRRTFIKNTSLLLGSSLLPYSNLFASSSKKQLGVCLVALGNYSTTVLAPALQLTKHCRLTGIVTGTPSKIPIWQKKYNIPDKNVYSYNTMDHIANNPEIDILYIVLPTGLHAKYAIKAANTGKHVWCEKPMAKTEEECLSIIKACQKNKVKLSIGYRMQHEPNTQQIIKWATTKPYGDIKTVYAEIGYNVGNPAKSWRLDSELGGGTMYDLGVYSLNAARYTTGEEPISVIAEQMTTRPKIFTETDETTHFTLEFPSGAVAHGKTSVGHDMHRLRVDSDNGWYQLQPFSMYSGVQGETSDGKLLNTYIENQQAKQMDDDALSILNNTNVLVPGEEGMKDIRIVEAIYNSAKSNRKINLI
ncbi:gfo/Idh/MocA family oxidoreductase [Aquimarina sp. BL5]|uniref:Gfo/Idh/MocA family protein n=1 Tax=Aquimarina sp. BL5 TaxID=1714860 RepID=UPI000E46CD52|nr:Gfo/Idh/MocA family oxidoreductase [Aquimarina sp. BL5]AXT51635.1 gfo/Idh/MocA family oxidoreductase [Aquimarina sp. BL5]RKN08533.1 gfo/Idh/MocA family oxidoreductase [Aquimarina sp. BL5]